MKLILNLNFELVLKLVASLGFEISTNKLIARWRRFFEVGLSKPEYACLPLKFSRAEDSGLNLSRKGLPSESYRLGGAGSNFEYTRSMPGRTCSTGSNVKRSEGIGFARTDPLESVAGDYFKYSRIKTVSNAPEG